MSSRYRLYIHERKIITYLNPNSLKVTFLIHVYIYIYVDCKSRIPRNVVLFTWHSKRGNCFLQRQWSKCDL
jgi:hypothetical protein